MVRALPPQTARFARIDDRDDEMAPPLLHAHHHEAGNRPRREARSPDALDPTARTRRRIKCCACSFDSLFGNIFLLTNKPQLEKRGVGRQDQKMRDWARAGPRT
jgi:hypothetical protein